MSELNDFNQQVIKEFRTNQGKVGGQMAGVPLLLGRPLVAEQAAAYVCRGMVCDAPVTDVDRLLAALQN